MLVLKRRRDQVVKIGPDVRVQVLEISDEWVTLGIEAPPSLMIDDKMGRRLKLRNLETANSENVR